MLSWAHKCQSYDLGIPVHAVWRFETSTNIKYVVTGLTAANSLLSVIYSAWRLLAILCSESVG